MKAKKLVLLLDVIVVAIITIAMMTGTVIKTTNLAEKPQLMAEKTDLSFDLIASPEEKRVKAGETVEITLSAQNIKIGEEGLNSIVGKLGYNESLFEKVEIKAEQEKGWNIELNQIKDHSMYGKFCIYTMKEGVTDNQDVVKLTMKLKKDLKPQTTKVTFTELASSNGEVEVLEEDREVTIIIYEDEVPTPEPAKPDPVKPTPVQTSDNKLIVIIAVAILTILLNVLTFGKSKKGKMLSTILVMVIGLSCAGIISYAAENNINVKDVINKLSYKQTWLNSEKYLVTEENVSRIAPGTKVETVKNKFNKEVIVTKDGKEVQNGTVVGTGMKVSVKNPSKADAEGDYAYEISVFGDTNGDGKSNQVELTRIIRNVVDSKKWELTGAKFKSADFTVDNKINEEDVNKSVKYIVYGDMEIPEFEQVQAPTIEVIEGTFDEEDNCYTTDVKVKITETAKNGVKTQYKVENSNGIVIPFTEISREETEDGKYERIIELKKNEIYKISAYTTGKLGNRSEIPYLIVNGIYNNIREYTVEYYYKNLKNEEANIYEIDNSKTEKQYAEIGTQITTYTDKNKLGYELATEKGTNGVEGLPLTINKDASKNVIKVYYKITRYTIDYNPNGGEWPNGVNPNPSTYTIENPTITVINPNRTGYTITGWTENEDDEPENPKTIPEGTTGKITITAQWKEAGYKITGAIVGDYSTHGSISGIPQTKAEGATSDDITINADYGYKIDTVKVFNMSNNEKTDEGTDWRFNKRTGKITAITNINSDKYIEVTLKELGEVAKIVAVPDDNQELTEVLSLVDNQPVLNHIYKNLESAIKDAEKINQQRDILGLEGKVEIQILTDIDDVEPNTIKEKNDVILDLNGNTITNDDEDEPIITVKENGSLQIIDKNETSENSGSIINTVGKAIEIQDGGELTIGKLEQDTIANPPSTTEPLIQGAENAIYKADEGILNFYDGELKNEDGPIIGNNAFIDNYPDHYVPSAHEGTSYILQGTSDIEAVIGYTTYTNLEDAFTAVNGNSEYTLENPATIKVISEHLVDVTQTATLAENKSVILDVNGRKITRTDSGTENIIVVEPNATLKIIDSTSTPDEEKTYNSLIKDANDYYFVAENNYIEPNNIKNIGTTAKSHIEIDLTNKPATEEFTLEMNAAVVNGGTNTKGFEAYVLTESQRPSSISRDDYLYSPQYDTQISSDNASKFSMNAKRNSSKVLNGGNKYYLYLDYTAKDCSYVRIYGLTLNGEDLLKEVIMPKGEIFNKRGMIKSASGATIIIDGARLQATNTNTEENYAIFAISKEIQVKSGIIEGSIEYQQKGEFNIKGGTITGSIQDRTFAYGEGATATVENDAFVAGTVFAKKVNIDNCVANKVQGETVNISNNSWILSEVLNQPSDSPSANPEDSEIKNSYVYKLKAAGNKANVQNSTCKSIVCMGSTRGEGTVVNITDSNIGAINTTYHLNGNTISNTGKITVNINNGEIGPIKTNYNEGGTQSNETVTLNITGGKIESDSTAIETDAKSTINIGTKNENNNINNPTIIGKTQGIAGACTLNFYDGTIISPTNKGLVGVTLNETETVDNVNLGIVKGTTTIDSVQYETCNLAIVYTMVARVNSANVDVSGLNSSQYELNTDENKYYFTSLEAAISACTARSDGYTVIEVIDDINELSPITIASGKMITIDLAGNTVQLNGIVNNANIKLTDTATTKGELKGAVTNNETLIVDSVKISNQITNNKALTVNDGELSNITGTADSQTTITAGSISGTVESKGTITINKNADKNLSIVAVNAEGPLSINGGNFGDITCNNNETSNISNAKVSKTNNRGTIEIKEGSAVNISNCEVEVLTNWGTVNLKDANTINNLNNNGTSAKITAAAGSLNVQVATNNGEITIPEACIFTLQGAWDSAHETYGATSLSNDGTLIIGTENDTVHYEETFKAVNAKIYNNGTLKFYDGRVYGKVINAGNYSVYTQEGYELTEHELDGQTVTDLQEMQYLCSVASDKIGSVDGIEHYAQIGDNYYFYSISDAANAIGASPATINIIKDLVSTSDSESEEIPEGKTVTIDLNGHTLSFTANDAIINNGTLTMKNTQTTGEVISTQNFIKNNGTLKMENGNYCKDGNNSVLVNSGRATILENVKIQTHKATDCNMSTVEAIKNIENGYMEIVSTTTDMYSPSNCNLNCKITNETNSENPNAGIKLTGKSNYITLENETGYATLENCSIYIENITSTNNAYVTNEGNLTVKGSSSKISSITGSGTSSCVKVEDGEIYSISANDVYIGKETDDVTKATPAIHATPNATNKLHFNCGTITGGLGGGSSYVTKENMHLKNVIIPENADLNIVKDTSTYTATLVAKQNEAQIGSTPYTTLAAAIAAANNGDEIDILTNIVITEARGEIDANKDITIDLNGHSITRTIEKNAIINTGNLTIKDSVGNGYLTSYSNINSVIQNKGKLTIDSTLHVDNTHEFKVSNTENGTTIIANNNNLEGAVICNSNEFTRETYGDPQVDGYGTIEINNSKVGKVYSFSDDKTKSNITISQNSTIGKLYAIATTVTANNSELTYVDISNYSKVSITNCTSNNQFSCSLSSTADDENSTITNGTYKILSVSGAKLVVSGVTADKVNSGDVKLVNCTVGSETSNDTALTVRGGKTTLIEGSYKSGKNAIELKAGAGMFAKPTELCIGENNNQVLNTPTIEGGTYGIYHGGGEISFYDGIITGGTKAINGYISYQPAAYKVVTTTDKKQVTLELIGGYIGILKVGDITYNRENINTAVTQAIESGEPIYLQDNIGFAETWQIAQGLGTDKTVTINLNGHTIIADMEDPIINNTVTLNIEGNGTISNASGKAIAGTGVLNIGSGVTIEEKQD